MPLKEEIKQLIEQTDGILEAIMCFFEIKESIYGIHWVDRIYSYNDFTYYFVEENSNLLKYIGSQVSCAIYKRGGYTAVVLKGTYKENILYVSNTGVNNG